ncbi:MmcQ/YjbR family DNA-binding protein [Cochlodiniinecator piscidefendens]|uniref:MmcQ/YjbR family DNA-binding protein n=1 Tax=Cochlodiniinecator piscidefendens TaxID=2715756 RepID=UPI002F42F30A
MGNTANNNGVRYVHGATIAHFLTLPRLEIKSAPRKPTSMSRDFVNQICATFPNAEVNDPWGGGHDAWKIGEKMFACIGSVGNGVSVKCADVETAQMLIECGQAVRAPYFHKSWIRIPFETLDDDFLKQRLEISYSLVRAGLTKKLQATLGVWP